MIRNLLNLISSKSGLLEKYIYRNRRYIVHYHYKIYNRIFGMGAFLSLICMILLYINMKFRDKIYDL